MHLYSKRAVLEGLEVEIFNLVASSATPEQWKEWLRMPLERAAARGNIDLFNKLLGAGADGSAAVHVAAESGHDGMVSTLLMRGVDKDALDDGKNTPLIHAADEGHLRVVTTLLAAGADCKVRNNDGYSALDYAASKGHVNVFQAILGHGANVNARNDDGYTALHMAARSDQACVVDALVEAGADVELMCNLDTTPLANAALFSSCKAMLALRQCGAEIHARDKFGSTALHLACFGKRRGLEVAVDLLLRWGADETAVNNDGQTPADVLLNFDFGDGDDKEPAKHDEVERTRLLLLRAPADRAWRSRVCWSSPRVLRWICSVRRCRATSPSSR